MKKKALLFISLLLLLCGCGETVQEEPMPEPIGYSEPIYLMVKNNSGIETIEDLVDKNIAVQENFDSESSDYVKNILLENNIPEENFITCPYYQNIPVMLENGEIDAWIISKPEHELLHDYVDFYHPEEYKTIGEYQIPIYEEKEVDSSIINDELFTKPFAVMCTGIDERSDPDDNANCRNDVDILMIVDPVNRHVLTISFPRDSYVYGVKNGYADKLTHLGVWGGVENIKDSIGELLGIEVPYYCQVSFSSFVDLITTIGGVYVDVPLDMTMDQNSYRDVANPVTLEKGYFKLYGEWALALCRNRKYGGIAGGDYGRIRNQALVVNGIIEKFAAHPVLVDWTELIWKHTLLTYNNFSDHQIEVLLELARTFNEGYSVDNYFIENIGDMTDYGAYIGRITEYSLKVATSKAKMVLNGSIDEADPYYEDALKGYVTGGSGSEGYIGTEYSLKDLYAK